MPFTTTSACQKPPYRVHDDISHETDAKRHKVHGGSRVFARHMAHASNFQNGTFIAAGVGDAFCNVSVGPRRTAVTHSLRRPMGKGIDEHPDELRRKLALLGSLG